MPRFKAWIPAKLDISLGFHVACAYLQQAQHEAAGYPGTRQDVGIIIDTGARAVQVLPCHSREGYQHAGWIWDPEEV